MSSSAPSEEWRDGLVQLGPDWVLGADGVPFRKAARVILLDQDDRLLLARGHDMDEPERHWWFTVGGGIEVDEDPRDAAVRELMEETGLVVAREVLVGPVVRRSALFDFVRRTVRQDEVFFLARIEDPAAVVHHGWTEIERGFMDEVRWWDLESLAREAEQVYPDGLARIVTAILSGWDGHLLDLGETA